MRLSMKRFRSCIVAGLFALASICFVAQPAQAVPPYCEYTDSAGLYHIIYEGLIPGWDYTFDGEEHVSTAYGLLGGCPS